LNLSVPIYSSFYLQNIREIIFDAQKRNTLVGMVDLPALYEEKRSNKNIKKCISL